MEHRTASTDHVRRGGLLAVLVTALVLLSAAPANAGGFSYLQMPPRDGIALPGSPFRWRTFVLGGDRRHVTVVARIRRADDRIVGKWHLAGRWHLSAPAYDAEGAGVAGSERAVVVARYDQTESRGLRRETHLALIHVGLAGGAGKNAVEHITLPGDYGVWAISPNGSKVFLVHTRRLDFGGEGTGPRFTIEPYDVRAGRISREAAIRLDGETLRGVAGARTQDRTGQRVYTLYFDGLGTPRRAYLLALDSRKSKLISIELPRLSGTKNPLAIDLHLTDGGRYLALRKRTFRQGGHRERRVLRVNLVKLWRTRGLPTPPHHRLASTSGGGGSLSFLDASSAHHGRNRFGVFDHVVGRSVEGRPIELREVGDLALPPRLLVFGCIHGDECGASALEPTENGCPAARTHALVVTNLDPDGSVAGSRLNADGVDLNRNFPFGWRSSGAPGDPEYPGARPFSEPETRLAARLIRRVQPRVTIWFHQHWGPGAFVRAWGQSVPAARRFAASAGIDFRLIRWPAGTAPNWQNHRFPGTASFVVELPRGRLAPRTDIPASRSRLPGLLDTALADTGREVEEDVGAATRR